jgi:hypothetical protein
LTGFAKIKARTAAQEQNQDQTNERLKAFRTHARIYAVASLTTAPIPAVFEERIRLGWKCLNEQSIIENA